MGIAWRLLVAVPLLAGLGWAGMVAVDIARADALVREASAEMGSWSSRAAVPERGTWQGVRDKLAAAERILPTDPTLLELSGLLGSMRQDDPEAVAAGIAHLTRSLELRPVSPYAWANLAEARYRRGEPGRNLQLAFARAAELGPAEPGVQRTVANYGLAVWDEVDAPTQAAIDRLVGAGFRRNPLEMLQISERRGRLHVACRHLEALSRTTDPRWLEACKGGEVTP